VIASCLMRPSLIEDVRAVVKPADFYRDSHRAIWATVCELSDRHVPVDNFTVLQALRSRELPEIRDYTTAIMSKAGPNAIVHARAVAGLSVRRKLVEAAFEVIGMACGDGGETEEIINQCQSAIMSVTASGDSQRLREGFDIIGQRVWDDAEKRSSGVGSAMGLTMGFAAFDQVTMGFQPGDLAALVGRAKQGKTALALHIADHIAIECQSNVLIFEREMIASKLYTRMLCSRARIKAKEFLQGMWGADARVRAKDAFDRLYTGRVQVVDMTKGPLTPAMMRRECRSMRREQGLDFVVVDYLELMQPDRPIQNERERLDECIRQLKEIAGEFRCTVFVLCQVGRQVEGREDVRPHLSDIRGSGGIEAALDWAFAIYNQNWYARQKDPSMFADDPERLLPDEVEVNTLASRSDASPSFKVGFIPGYTHFYDLGINGPEF
jgi:replicative DNA helicase